jgi:hypothetical protein
MDATSRGAHPIPMPNVPFAHIGPSHPYASLMAELRDAIAALELPGDGRLPVQAELKVARDAGSGAFVPDRFYWSEQARPGDAPFSFAARTLTWSARSRAIELITFPQDPYLTSAIDLLGRWARQGVSGRVLRYVPLRRLRCGSIIRSTAPASPRSSAVPASARPMTSSRVSPPRHWPRACR